MGLTLTATATGSSSLLQQARDLYYQGIYGDRSAQERSDSLFTKLHDQSPENPLVTVYFGSLRLIEARHTWALWKKNSLSKEGIHLMDKAVDKSPDNLEVRFVRAATERELPSFFGRKEQSANDFHFIASHAQEAVMRGSFEPRLAAASLFYYGDWCREQSKIHEAEEAWRDAVRIAPESNGGRKSADELSKLGVKG